MKKLKVELGASSYEVRIGSGLLPRMGLWLKEREYSNKAVIITDTTVGELYADELERGLANAGFEVTILEVPAGEEQKSLETASRLYDDLTEAYAERTTPVLALGGVDARSVGQCLRAGAHGVAVLSAIWNSPDPLAAAREIRASLDAELGRVNPPSGEARPG